jgi:hypothetical protein
MSMARVSGFASPARSLVCAIGSLPDLIVRCLDLNPRLQTGRGLSRFYKVLDGALRERIRTIIRQVCKELGVQIVSGVLSREYGTRQGRQRLGRGSKLIHH